MDSGLEMVAFLEPQARLAAGGRRRTRHDRAVRHTRDDAVDDSAKAVLRRVARRDRDAVMDAAKWLAGIRSRVGG